MENPIEFRKRRDFGEVFSDTFRFLTQEFRPLSLSIIYYALPFILISAVSLLLFMNKFRPFIENPEAISPSGFLKDIIFNYLLILIFFLLNWVILLSTINNYIALYVEKGKGNFTQADVLQRISANFWPMLFTAILAGIMINIGIFLCIIPGIYLGVSLSLIFIALAFEKKGFGDALTRTFDLTHKQWWWTLLLLFVIYLILILVILIPYCIFLIVYAGSIFHFSLNNEFTPDKTFIFMRGYSIILAVLIIISSILQVIPQTAMALQYFNLAEMKNDQNSQSSQG